jgi:hypothetical protein
MAGFEQRSTRCPTDPRGFDAGKKVVGRKPHIAIGTGGRLLIRFLLDILEASIEKASACT